MYIILLVLWRFLSDRTRLIRSTRITYIWPLNWDHFAVLTPLWFEYWILASKVCYTTHLLLWPSSPVLQTFAINFPLTWRYFLVFELDFTQRLFNKLSLNLLRPSRHVLKLYFLYTSCINSHHHLLYFIKNRNCCFYTLTMKRSILWKTWQLLFFWYSDNLLYPD